MNAEFEVHILNETGKEKARKIAETFDACLTQISSICFGPKATEGGREDKLVRTKLEEACFFAKKAMAKQPENTNVGVSA